jgi:type III pantothenate kinase
VLLAIDVGNTNTVFGVMDGTTVQQTFRITTTSRTTDELGILIVQLLNQNGFNVEQIKGAITSSVVPSTLYTLNKMCRNYLKVDLKIVGQNLKSGISVRTDNPREVGADRIVNAVAAVERWGGPVIIVDFGTATTFDCVNAKGEYIGGAIAPGFKISEIALFEQTAKLPRVDIVRPPHAIGRNTVHAMQSGLFFGYVGLVDGLARRIRDEMGGEVQIVATGGLSSLVAQESQAIDQVDHHLTLRGLALLYARNSTDSKPVST